MKQIGWIALTLIFLALSVGLVALPDLRDLRRGKVWTVHSIDAESGELAGVTVLVDQVRAMVLPGAPDRAVLYLRMGLQGQPDSLRAWLACDIGLVDSRGRIWRPLTNAAGLEIIAALGEEGETDNNCDQSRILPPEDGSPSMSVQAFLVPSALLDELRLRVTGFALRPDAISLPIRPVLQPPV